WPIASWPSAKAACSRGFAGRPTSKIPSAGSLIQKPPASNHELRWPIGISSLAQRLRHTPARRQRSAPDLFGAVLVDALGAVSGHRGGARGRPARGAGRPIGGEANAEICTRGFALLRLARRLLFLALVRRLGIVSP